MPPVDAMAFLRPYKRDIPGKKPAAATPPKTPAKRPRAPPPKKDEDDDLARPRPQGSYREFKLMSTAGDNWKHDIFKFDSRKPVDLDAWAQPLKLNRKNPPPREGDEVVSKGPITPMLGLDGKPVIGPDGEPVYMQDGRPVPRAKKEEDGDDEDGAALRPKEPAKKRKPFQKKTRQIFTIPEEQRQLQREERYPWVLEDKSGQETWIGRIENADKASYHGLFLTGTGSDFYFVPAHRWYKMQKRPNFKTATMEEVEAQYARLQKNHTLEFWKKRQQQSQEAVAAAEAQGKPINLGHIPHQPSLVRSSGGQSLAANGRRLRTVIKGDTSLFGDDDDDELKDSLRKRREKELGEEGDLDEIEYEEEFADDDEKMNVDDDDDEEAKELEERIKRETRAANKLRQAGVEEDESDEDEDFLKNLTGAGKEVKKALRTHEKNALYDSDDEKNPYLTSEDEEEEETPTVQPTGVEPSATPTPSGSRPAKSSTPSQQKPGTPTQQKSGTPAQQKAGTPSQKPSAASKAKAQSKTPSRATSPSVPRAASPAAPPGSGSSLLAQRATSPKGKNVPGSSRATSPKVATPQHPAARATSPLAGGSGSRATSPTAPAPAAVKKRKAEDLSSPGTGAPVVKKAKPSLPPPGRKIDEAFVVEWLRAQPVPPTTMQCIGQFRPYLVDKKSKDVLTNIIRKVAELKGGVLTLRAGF